LKPVTACAAQGQRSAVFCEGIQVPGESVVCFVRLAKSPPHADMSLFALRLYNNSSQSRCRTVQEEISFCGEALAIVQFK